MDDEIARMLYAKRATPEPCHVCGGKCCRDDLGYRVVHMAAEFYEHVCDDCRDGEKYVPPRTAVSPLTLCTDPRCVSAQRCQRAENEDFGNAPGLNYGPRCTPAPALDLAAERLAALLDAEREIERLRAQRILSNEDFARSFDMGLAAGERRERAAVVAYLRGLADDYGVCIDLSLAEQADKIESGEHRREEEG